MLTGYSATSASDKSSGGRLAAIAFLSAFISTGVGFAIGNPWLFPFLNTLGVYPFYLELVLAGRGRQALALAIMWAVFLSQAVIGATYFFPERAEKVTIRGAEYRDEMFEWVATGEGEESSPRRFIPVHIVNFGVFCVLTGLTGGFAGLVMGAVLLNYMNYYVGALVLAARRPALTALIGWQPYAMIRVVSYIIVATALTEAFFALTRRRRLARRVKVWLAVGTGGVIVDILVKSLIAPSWSRMLKWSTGL